MGPMAMAPAICAKSMDQHLVHRSEACRSRSFFFEGTNQWDHLGSDGDMVLNIVMLLIVMAIRKLPSGNLLQFAIENCQL